jgi:hypothetical protein
VIAFACGLVLGTLAGLLSLGAYAALHVYVIDPKTWLR